MLLYSNSFPYLMFVFTSCYQHLLSSWGINELGGVEWATLRTPLFLFYVICTRQTEHYSLVKYWLTICYEKWDSSFWNHCPRAMSDAFIPTDIDCQVEIRDWASQRGTNRKNRRQEKTRRADWAQRVVGIFMMQQYLRNCRRSVKRRKRWRDTGFSMRNL